LFAKHGVPRFLERLARFRFSAGLPGCRFRIGFLLLGFMLLGPVRLPGATPQLNITSKTLMDVSGGSGVKAWTIRYGTAEHLSKKFVAAEGNLGWLSHGGWLRQIDTEKGVVVGRWHFPGSIVHLTAAGQNIQIQLEDKEGNRVFTQLVSFDPKSDKVIDYWPSGNLVLSRVPFNEVEFMWGTPAKIGVLSDGWKLTSDQDPKKLISTLEEASRRDPLAPATRIALWRT
jgi:hypothetical protein